MTPHHANALRRALESGGFAVTVEFVVPEAREPFETAIAPALELAQAMKGEPRCHALAIGDRIRSDHDHDPIAVAERVAEAGGTAPLVHLAGKDRSAAAVRASLERLLALGLENVLLITGDKVKAPPGDRPVGHVDAVHAIQEAKALSPDFLVAAAVCPFKYREEECLNQYLKMVKKWRVGADCFITQIGFDMRKLKELIAYARARGLEVPLLANVLALTAGRGRYIREHAMPGITIPDELQALVEAEAQDPAKGAARALERLALQALLDRVEGLEAAIPTEAAWAEAWQASLTRPDGTLVPTAPPDGFYLDGGPPAQGVRASVGAYAKYLALDGLDRLLFQEGSPGARLFAPLARRLPDGSRLARAVHGFERLSKEPLGCQSCGVCRLPHTFYVCPETCPKGLANGPCGGTRENTCEFGDRECIHTLTYRLAKRAHALKALEAVVIPAVPAERRGTCSWIHHFRGQDPPVVRLVGPRRGDPTGPPDPEASSAS
ncbi:MAG: methylenetetrahydrofolate reductase C-terminal domain-containing protein [Candidatus Rokubacteria bacterium]|nr:methylenetetrahydrofolate reductase C-terminal domain-containing protein [Candidatus Rokubacteria bacterium]